MTTSPATTATLEISPILKEILNNLTSPPLHELNELDDETLIAIHQEKDWLEPSYILRKRWHSNIKHLSSAELTILVQMKSTYAKELLFKRNYNNLPDASDETLVLYWQHGNFESETILCDRYDSFFSKIARQFRAKAKPKGLAVEDLAQEAYLGLIKACRDYKIERKRNFSIFARLVVEKHIKNLLTQGTNGKNRSLNKSSSYHAPVSDNPEMTFEQMLRSERSLPHITVEKVMIFRDLWDSFKEEEKRVLLLYDLDYSYQEIGADIFPNKTPRQQYKKVDNALQGMRMAYKRYIHEANKAAVSRKMK